MNTYDKSNKSTKNNKYYPTETNNTKLINSIKENAITTSNNTLYETVNIDKFSNINGKIESDFINETKTLPDLTQEQESNSIFWIKLIILSIMILCLTGSIVFFDKLKAEFLVFIVYLKKHIILGSLCLILIKVIGTILYVPGVLLAVGVGFAYKQAFNNYLISVPIGVVIIMIGSCIGCSCAFFLGRFLFKSFLSRKLKKYKIFKALDKAIVSKGKKVNFLLRCSPAIPYNLVNYFLGITNTSYLHYLFGLIGFIPLVIVYVFVGSTISDLNKLGENKIYEIIGLLISLLISGICVYYITKIAKKELYKELDKKDYEQKV